MSRRQFGGRGKILMIGKFGAQRGPVKQLLDILGLFQSVLAGTVELGHLGVPVEGIFREVTRKGKLVVIAIPNEA